MYYVYILKSETNNKTYVGCSNNLERRLKEHNRGKSRFTSKFIPWKIVYTEEFNNRNEARARELYLKSAAGRRFIKKILGKISPRSSAG